jgi:outer membrane protein, heavy metal efflux system
MEPPARLRTWPAIVVATLGLATQAAAQTAAQPAPASVTLADAVAAARTQSPARQASLTRVNAAAAAQQWAGRIPNPFTEVRVENWAAGSVEGVGSNGTLPLDIFATITQTIELGAKRGARQGVAAAVTSGARVALWSTERELDADVARRFLAVLRERERWHTLSEQTADLGELVRVLERRVAEGLTAEADLRKLQTERVRIDTDAMLARMRADRGLAVLSALVGWSAAPALDALVRPTVAVPALASPDLDATVAASLAGRPDVRLAAARVEGSRQSLRFEQSRGVPDLSITGGLKRTSGYDTGVAAVFVPLPLFERNKAAVVVAQGNVAAAELELAQVERLAAGEARSALVAARELAERSARVPAELIDPAAVVRTAARSAFQSGAGDVLRLVDAERVYAEARMTVGDLSIDALLAAIDARLALAEDVAP